METLELSADTSEYSPIRKYAAMEIPENNPITLEKSALGRQLFWDERISGDGVRSCYYCHQCETGLADDKPKAIGAFEKTLTRNSPTLWNIGYHAQFYWDGRSPSLEAQVLAAWRGGNMGADTEEIVKRLNAIRGYKDQFKEVFNEDATSENVAKALATYMRLFISDTTPWDRWQEGNESAVNAAAKRGYELFKRAGCDNCHDGVLFTDLQYHNVGIGMDIEEPDLGRFKVTQNDKDRGAFKTPTLRDIRQSAPYFHDGSVATLEEAVDIMLGGGKDNSYLDRTNLKKFKLSSSEKQDLMEFLLSLEQPCGLYEPLLPPED
tara:strand:+ start:121 stop:1083 length:963 start_codon:yes stop_codon:yes gene_type:complete